MEIAVYVLAACVLVLAVLVVLLLRRGGAAPLGSSVERRIEQVASTQNEIVGRFAQALEGQNQLQSLVSQRLDSLDARLSAGMNESASQTAQTLGGIQERLSVIDQAQQNIAALSGHVIGLQEILSDKQTRGAFGQERMEAIVADQIPEGLYEFQATLSNKKRPDCIIRVVKGGPALVVDSKFPLEAFVELRDASTEDARRGAASKFRSSVTKHIGDISQNYLISGETQPIALMFLPSETIYAEMHASFPDLIQKARRENVVIVSPHIFMLATNMIQTLVRDSKMREQADLIRREVFELLKDVGRLGDRVEKLRTHFNNANQDISDIEVSMRKISARGTNIENVEVEATPTPPLIPS